MEIAQIEAVRGFNRAITSRIGALDGSYLGRGRPLGQARLLFEIGPRGCDLRGLREKLGLDSGYLSRLLSSLSNEGLTETESDPADRRRRRVVLTAKGREEWAAYDRLSEEAARSLLAPFGEKQRRRLIAAMGDVERLMRAAAVTIAPEPAESDDSRFCLATYFRELDRRFEEGFDPGGGGNGATETVCFLLAQQEGRPVGCGVLQRLDERTGEIKRMWLAPEIRGLGVAGRLLEALEDKAREAGMTRMRLDTNRALDEARALYARAGYREIARYNDNPYADFWFEKELA